MDKVNQLTLRLKQQGYTDQKITEFLGHLSELASEALYQKAMDSFDKQDLTEIESLKDQNEINHKVIETYIKKTGKDPNQQMRELRDKFIDGYLAGNDYGQSLK